MKYSLLLILLFVGCAKTISSPDSYFYDIEARATSGNFAGISDFDLCHFVNTSKRHSRQVPEKIFIELAKRDTRDCDIPYVGCKNKHNLNTKEFDECYFLSSKLYSIGQIAIHQKNQQERQNSYSSGGRQGEIFSDRLRQDMIINSINRPRNTTCTTNQLTGAVDCTSW